MPFIHLLGAQGVDLPEEASYRTDTAHDKWLPPRSGHVKWRCGHLKFAAVYTDCFIIKPRGSSVSNPKWQNLSIQVLSNISVVHEILNLLEGSREPAQGSCVCDRTSLSLLHVYPSGNVIASANAVTPICCFAHAAVVPPLTVRPRAIFGGCQWTTCRRIRQAAPIA